MKNSSTLLMLLSILSILLVAFTLLNMSVYAQEENMAVSEEPKFFGIQHAQYGSISEINSTNYLELNDVSDKTILFSDRPDRIVTSISTLDFIGNWSVGKDSFTVDPPNDVLVKIEKEHNIEIVEMFNPVYDIDKKTLNYEMTLENVTSIELPSEFGQTTVVIDTYINRDNFGGIK